MFIRNPYNYDADAVSVETGLRFTQEDYDTCPVDPSKAEDADINEIVRRFGVTGTVPVVPMDQLQVDFDQVVDFQTAMNAVKETERHFGLLPAEVRARFANDPGRLLSFLEDPANREEAVKLGLVNPPAPPKETPGDPKGAGEGSPKP